MSATLTLSELIEKFEETFPNREWLLRRDAEHEGYFASSVPIGYVGYTNRPNPPIVKVRAKTPRAALFTLFEQIRKYEEDVR